MGMSLALGASGNLIPTGDLDRLVKKDGPQKLGRSGNLRRFGRLVAKALPCVTGPVGMADCAASIDCTAPSGLTLP